MTARTTRAVAWSSWAVGMALAFAAAIFLVLGRSTPPPAGSFGFRGFSIVFAVTFGTVGALIASRHPDNAIGWVFLAMGVGSGLQELGQQYAIYAVLAHTGDPLPFGRAAVWLPAWIWIPIMSGVAFLLLLFPNGRLLSPRWRWLVGFEIVATAAAAVSLAVLPGPLTNFSRVRNPFGVGSYHVVLGVAGLTQMAFFLGVLASPIALVLRYRRSSGEERQQLKWLVAAAMLVAAALVASFVGVATTPGIGTVRPAYAILVIVGFASVPVATGIAILKYRLYDIDLVISRAVVFGTLAAFITAVYVAIVVGIGALLGAGTHSAALSIAATAVVALAFQPARDRVQRFANRLVYGRRATPYEVMAGFSNRVSNTLSTDDVLPEMAEAAVRGVGAARGRVRLFLPDGGERAVSWPGDGEIPESSEGSSISIDVVYQGTPIGQISIEKRSGELVTPAEQRLLTDLASQAGLAMHNVRLTEELGRRLEELARQSQALQVSRQRLVTARDVQRRGLERDIRDGPQHQLLEIGRKLRDAAGRVDREPLEAERILERLGVEATTTLEGLRDLARGIFPPLLAEKGVVAAIQAHIRKVGASATVEAPTVGGDRFDADTEAALYFICLQALQNVSRHAGNAPTVVRLARDGDELLLEIEDRGPGFDVSSTPRGMGIQIMQDRVDALDGSLSVGRGAAGGALISCRLPVRIAGEVPA